jgi:hypothetical protein
MPRSSYSPPPSYEAASYVRFAGQKRGSVLTKLWSGKVALAAKHVKFNKSPAKRVGNLAMVICEDLGIANRNYMILCSEDPHREDRHIW